jgi:hypothetical protein
MLRGDWREIIKRGLLALVLLGLQLQSAAAAPEVVWVAQAGGAGGHAKTRGIALDAAGNTYITGEYSVSATLGSVTLTCQGPLDGFVAKFDPTGKPLWARSLGGAAIDRGYGVAVDGEGACYVTGHFQNPAGITNGSSTAAKARLYDIFVAKFDAQGKPLWQQRLPGNGYDYGHGVSLDGTGNAYVAGAFSGAVTFGGFTLTNRGSSEAFIAKFDATGKVLWAEKIEAGTGNAANAIVHDRNGHCYLAGTFAGRATFGGRSLASAGGNDLLLVKFDAAGKPIWSRRAGGTTNDFAHSVAVDPAGNCYLSGAFQNVADFSPQRKITSVGKHDAYVAKYDANGNFKWVHHGGAEGTDYGLGVAVDAQQNCFLAGEFSGETRFGDARLLSQGATDIFLVKINAAGRQEWTLTAGGAKGDYCYCIAVDGEYAYISGGFTGPATFGAKKVTSAGLSDLFVAKVLVK